MRNDEIGAAWDYHRRTSHSRAEVLTGGSPPDWANQPRPYKVYPRLEPIPLPPARARSRMPALEVLASTGLAWGEPGTPSLEALAAILHYSAGVIRRLTLPSVGKTLEFRAASCTGALYHVDVYVVTGSLDGLEAGVYQFGPQDHALRRLRSGDWRAALVEACGDQSWVTQAPVSLVLTTTSWRNAWRYGERAYRHAFWDSGTILANVLALATAHGLPSAVVTGFVDRAVNRLLDLDAQKEVALAVVPLGYESVATPPAPGTVALLGLRTAVYSASETDYPAIRAMHTASSLSRPEDVREWRENSVEKAITLVGAREEAPTPGRCAARISAPPTSSPARGGGEQDASRLPLAHRRERGAGGEGSPSLTIEDCIQARRSARRFRGDPISQVALLAALQAATAGFQADCRAGLDTLLLVSAVDGLEPGVYRYRSDRTLLAILEPRDDVREVAGRLVLDEPRGAGAAVLVLLMADLTTILGRLGNRGYRAAQLEAGIVAGKIYLAATETDLGVTGLTFYDDEVSRLFEAHAPGQSAMLMVALGAPG